MHAIKHASLCQINGSNRRPWNIFLFTVLRSRNFRGRNLGITVALPDLDDWTRDHWIASVIIERQKPLRILEPENRGYLPERSKSVMSVCRH